MELRLHDLRPG